MIDTTRPRGRPNPPARDDQAPPPPPEPPVEHWAALVLEARRRCRLSQTALGQAAGVTQQTISKVEQGDICPHDRLKLRLAAALGVPPGELFPWPVTA